jgi:hypothetical protein
MLKGATIIGDFRYRLWRCWGGAGSRSACFVMLNPSTADASEDDPTLTRIIGFAKAWGFGSLDVVNLYSYRATDPEALRSAGFPVGEYTDETIAGVLSRDIARGGYADKVIVGWGTNAQRHRTETVLKLIRGAGFEPHALKITKLGAPQHPLYLPATSEPVPYKGEVHPKCYAWAQSKPRKAA